MNRNDSYCTFNKVGGNGGLSRKAPAIEVMLFVDLDVYPFVGKVFQFLAYQN